MKLSQNGDENGVSNGDVHGDENMIFLTLLAKFYFSLLILDLSKASVVVSLRRSVLKLHCRM